jgi:hypothetical protein
MKTHQRRKDEQKRKRIAEEFIPLVLWADKSVFLVDETSRGRVDIEEVIRREVRDAATDIPFISIATRNEPHVESVITEFDDANTDPETPGESSVGDDSEKASEAVSRVISELQGRQGFTEFWESIDDDIKENITMTLESHVEDTYDTNSNA